MSNWERERDRERKKSVIIIRTDTIINKRSRLLYFRINFKRESIKAWFRPWSERERVRTRKKRVRERGRRRHGRLLFKYETHAREVGCRSSSSSSSTSSSSTSSSRSAVGGVGLGLAHDVVEGEIGGVVGLNVENPDELWLERVLAGGVDHLVLDLGVLGTESDEDQFVASNAFARRESEMRDIPVTSGNEERKSSYIRGRRRDNQLDRGRDEH